MLPKNLKYGSKVESAMAKSTRVNIQPQNGTGPYSLGDTIIINIPTRSNLVMVPSESYLKFSNTITAVGANNGYRWDSCGAHGLIQRIRIYHGSNLLQDIDNYGLLAKMLFDIQVSTDSSYGKLNMMAGTRNDLVVTYGNVGDALSANQVNSGESFRSTVSTNVSTALQPIAGAPSQFALNGYVSYTNTYCLNLVSLVGSLCTQNYLPLFAMTSAPLRVEIQLVSAITSALNVLVDGKISTTNVEYIANFIELGDPAMSMIYESLNGEPLQFVVPDYRNYQHNALLSTSNTQISMPIPAKFSSLKSLFITIRDKVNTATFYPYSSSHLKLTEYYFRIGSQIMPTKAPNTHAEMFCEVMKAIGSIADLNHQPSIERFSYTSAGAVANTYVLEAFSGTNVGSGSFYIGLDLENYSSADKTSIFAGFNSNTDDIFATMTFAGQGADLTARFDAFAMFDVVVVFENNTAYVKF